METHITELITQLIDFLDNKEIIFLQFEPEISDFTKEYTGKMKIQSSSEEIEFHLPNKNINSFAGFLSTCVFSKFVLTWDIKRFFSYLYFRLPRSYEIEITGKLFDIKYLELFSNIKNEQPVSFYDAYKRVNKCPIHHNIHIPLAVKVIPKIETHGIVNNKLKKICYPFYEIEGQVNGRLNSRKEFELAIAMHQLERDSYTPRLDHTFIQFDYKCMEVYVLQYLSKDEKLGKIINSGKDIYETISRLLEFGNRSFVKETFLPVVYGLQPDNLAEKHNISVLEARKYIDNLYSFFSTAFSWIKEQSDNIKINPIAQDIFGRKRDHRDKPWGVRNAIVQGTASVICLEKLIHLFDFLPVVANIHDAYFLEVLKSDVEEVVNKGKKILEQESEMCKGLKLKVEIQVGDHLNNLEKFNG